MSEIESFDKRRFAKIASDAGWFQDSIIRTARNSFPDSLFIKDGRWVAVEWKSDTGKLSAKQRVRHEELRRHGAEVYVTSSVDEAKRILGIV